MMIFDASLEDEAIDGWLKRSSETVSGSKGHVVSIDRWGKRQLAYEVDHKREGNYVVMTFSNGDTTLDELNRLLRLTEDVIRYKIIRLPDKLRSSVEKQTSKLAV